MPLDSSTEIATPNDASPPWYIDFVMVACYLVFSIPAIIFVCWLNFLFPDTVTSAKEWLALSMINTLGLVFALSWVGFCSEDYSEEFQRYTNEKSNLVGIFRSWELALMLITFAVPFVFSAFWPEVHVSVFGDLFFLSILAWGIAAPVSMFGGASLFALRRLKLRVVLRTPQILDKPS